MFQSARNIKKTIRVSYVLKSPWQFTQLITTI